MKFSAVPYRDTYRIVASVSWYVSYRDFAGDTKPYPIPSEMLAFELNADDTLEGLPPL